MMRKKLGRRLPLKPMASDLEYWQDVKSLIQLDYYIPEHENRVIRGKVHMNALSEKGDTRLHIKFNFNRIFSEENIDNEIEEALVIIVHRILESLASQDFTPLDFGLYKYIPKHKRKKVVIEDHTKKAILKIAQEALKTLASLK